MSNVARQKSTKLKIRKRQARPNTAKGIIDAAKQAVVAERLQHNAICAISAAALKDFAELVARSRGDARLAKMTADDALVLMTDVLLNTAQSLLKCAKAEGR